MSPESVREVTDDLLDERAFLDEMIALVKGGYLHVDDSGEVERYGLTLKGEAERKRGSQ